MHLIVSDCKKMHPRFFWSKIVTWNNMLFFVVLEVYWTVPVDFLIYSSIIRIIFGNVRPVYPFVKFNLNHDKIEQALRKFSEAAKDWYLKEYI